MEARRRGRARGAAPLLCLLVCGLAGCGESEAPVSRDLPREWYTATRAEGGGGGRHLPERRAVLDRLQERVRSDGIATPHAHYRLPQTVVLAVKRDFVESGTRRRLALLLEHEAADPELGIVALVDGPPDEIEAALDLGAALSRVRLVPSGLSGPSPVTFQFVRDYAPIALSAPSGGGRVAAGLALFRGPLLNKIVDVRQDVRLRRSPQGVRTRHALSRRLVEVYREHLGGDVPVVDLALRLDGGNLLSDGLGTCFATRVLLAQNRDDRPFVERELGRLGCRRSVFLAAPRRLDFVQHVDTLLFVAGPRDVVLSMPTLYESDRIAEFQNVRLLLEAGYTVHRLPRRTASVTYTNVLVTRRNVYVPQYSRYEVESERQRRINARVRALDPERHGDLRAFYLDRPVDTATVADDPVLEEDNRRAIEVIGRLLPGRRVVPVPSDETLSTRGSWHCWSHELPRGPGAVRAQRSRSSRAASSAP